VQEGRPKMDVVDVKVPRVWDLAWKEREACEGVC